MPGHRVSGSRGRYRSPMRSRNADSIYRSRAAANGARLNADLPSIAHRASASPMAAACLNPCPEQGNASMIRSESGFGCCWSRILGRYTFCSSRRVVDLTRARQQCIRIPSLLLSARSCRARHSSVRSTDPDPDSPPRAGLRRGQSGVTLDPVYRRRRTPRPRTMEPSNRLNRK